MKLINFSQFNNSSDKDANTFAPSTCSAKNEMNNVNLTDIAVAVSVFLCLLLGIINIINLCVLGILVLSIILINKAYKKRQPASLLN